MKNLSYLLFFSIFFFETLSWSQTDTSYAIWTKVELSFASDKTYENALYDVKEFGAVFTSPTGRTKKLNGFWNGTTDWKIRFLPDEIGEWRYETFCSDEANKGLIGQKGQFNVAGNKSAEILYRRGTTKVSKGDYHLTYADGTPFFLTACTAWNGALKSTDEEWDTYLKQRKRNSYNTIQYVTTQWRGCETNAEGLQAYSGQGKIEINTSFFERIDKKTDEINAHGLLAAPVVLWALPVGDGRHLSPGYSLPTDDATLLAKYIVARLQGNHVLWILGGDGDYLDENEDRWKFIGREVFGDIDNAPTTLHPKGSSWIGKAYEDEDWLDFVAYQSSHSNRQGVVDWINKGPMAKTWHSLPAKPLINMEPNYEEIKFEITAEDVRNASYWSIFATPISGITYGANGIWPWIQKEGELIENHGNPGGRGPSTWRKSIDFPGSKQIGLLSNFVQGYPWWTLKPARERLIGDPTEKGFNRFISVVADNAKDLIIGYVPKPMSFSLRLAASSEYKIKWFDPITGKTREGVYSNTTGMAKLESPSDQDWVFVLERKR